MCFAKRASTSKLTIPTLVSFQSRLSNQITIISNKPILSVVLVLIIRMELLSATSRQSPLGHKRVCFIQLFTDRPMCLFVSGPYWLIMTFGFSTVFLRLIRVFVRMSFDLSHVILTRISAKLMFLGVRSKCWNQSYKTTRKPPNGIHVLYLACLLDFQPSILLWFYWFSICALGNFASVSRDFW